MKKKKMRKVITAEDRDPYLRKLKDPHSFTVKQLLSKSLVSLFVMTGKSNTSLAMVYVQIWIKKLDLHKKKLLQNKKGKKLDIAYQVRVKEINNVISGWRDDLLIRHKVVIEKTDKIGRNSRIKWKNGSRFKLGKVKTASNCAAERLKMIPVIHTICGNVVMHFVVDPSETIVKSADVRYLDGSTPKQGSAIPFCPFCGVQMWPGYTLRRKITEQQKGA
jgi:hypothetical protein